MDDLQLFFCLSIWLRNVQSCSDRPVFYGVKIKSRVEKEERELSSMCLMNLLIHNFTIFFFSSWVFFQDHSRISGLQWKGDDIFQSSIPLPLALQTPIHQLGDYCKEQQKCSTQVSDRLKLGTFGFRVQTANH